MSLDANFLIALLSLLVSGGISSYLAIFMRQANRRKVEADERKTRADAADILVEAAGDVVQQLREQMHQLQVNATYDRERLDDQAEKIAELRINLEKAVEELAAAQLEITQLVNERDNQARRIQVLEDNVKSLECENLLLRDRLSRYERSGDG